MVWQTDLHNKIDLICPITSIRFVSRKNKSTWKIFFHEKATEEQQKLAQEILDNFDLNIIDLPEKSEIEILKERIAALEAKELKP